ncbi:sulfurtransferase [Kitasatospora sp. GP82]|uniref:sulfurtransferase n=1 Tax=Kitasatospora sp. GP82 TaxID=3035089 RepID=UPI00247590BD|nr:sulfurtransferase [Kitasatospora sp. GP82]MDH6128774.1 thiosulfate/3-mercaptopyruvate sulfurtransferase [Kitasatospora sp. GP82]
MTTNTDNVASGPGRGSGATSPLSVPGPLVTVGWLAERLDHPDLVVLDASVGADRGAELRIPGARLFDLDGALSDRSSPLPHTMPGAEHFAREMRALGVNDSSAVVAYDRVGIYSSARAWWMLRAMGFDRVAVLDGGLPAWVAAGLPRLPPGVAAPPPGDFVARPREGLIVDSGVVQAALSDGASAVLDARSRERFAGQVEEPRPGLRSGHMPGAVNLPFGDLQTDGRMRPAGELLALFFDLVGRRERLIFSCGSGVTACNLALGAELAGYRDLAVYDGSWSEWGLPSELPVAAGPVPAGPVV